ncbi:MAG: NAD(P)H-hydrate dehydratase [Oscillospiraceae bacterium]|jgi:NAD(P)H-hydrate epimerase|nr:NAD(P)H-hydrate dehydratase [Oscillospiraceae bacterium]
MIRAIAPADMLALEQRFMKETGAPALLLMEHAAMVVADALAGYRRVLFMCGPGSNGGDGLAAARLFASRGGDAVVWQFGGGASGVIRQQSAMLAGVGVPIRRVGDSLPELPRVDCVVDALFGIGLARPVAGVYADAVGRVNGCGASVLAVDIASGIDGETGRLLGAAVRADHTVTFHRPKPGHYLYPGREYTGRLTIAPIGIPPPYGVNPTDPTLLEDSDVGAFLPPRKADSHKGNYGNILVLAGSAGMAGAAAICAKAALCSGAGLVTVACPSSVLPIAQTLIPEATALAIETPDDVRSALGNRTCAAVGPGLGRGALPLLEPLLTADIPQVWDADALNALADSGLCPPANTVVTPHPGEAARLLGMSVPEIAADPVKAARLLRQRTGAVTLLKGSTTVVTDGEAIALNVNGSPAMAKGGMGDALTGVIAAMLAQGLPPYDAARVGAFLHGQAGSRAAAALGERSALASDLIDYLSRH